VITPNTRIPDPTFPYGFGDSASQNLGTPRAASKTRLNSEPAHRVFVVDDEVLIADSVAQILRRNGFAASAFYHAQDALDEARVQCPHTLVSDVLMPDLNGVQLAIAMRSHCPATRIILFSGQAATVDLLREAEQEGYFFELLAKPIHPRQLLKALVS
jgi:DNA-binding NtrC family response regulator